MASAKIKPHSGLHLDVSLSGDKSMSHRAAIFAALSEGPSTLTNFSTGADCANTLAGLESLGVAIKREPHSMVITGNGLGGLRKPARALDCGNSGTSARLFAGILAGQNFDSALRGDASLSRRPMQRILEPLKKMGGRIVSNVGKLPLEISGNRLKAIDYTLSVPSAQVKSCVLFAGLFAEGTTVVRETIPSRDHTERMGPVKKEKAGDTTLLSVIGGQKISFQNMTIPGDISSAAFLIAAALWVPNSEIRIRHVGLNPTRTGFLDALRLMGASVQLENRSHDAVEPYGDVIVKTHQGKLKSLSLKGKIIPNLMDEIPVLAVLGTRCDHGLEVRDAQELRTKECDRIEAIVNNLRAMGAAADEFDDGFFVHPSELHAAHIQSGGDHRIAMAFAVAGMAADKETVIEDAECVNISFPEFFDYLEIETDTYELEIN